MTMSLPGLLLFIVIAAVCGAIAGSAWDGLIVSIAQGFIGTLVGPWVGRLLKLPEPFVVTIDRHPFPILWSLIGATLFVAVIHLFSRRRSSWQACIHPVVLNGPQRPNLPLRLDSSL